MTGKSEGDLIEARMNRLRLEGTPRIKRERRQHAPPISPLAADTDFSDFMIPMGDNGQDFDFGTAAMRMLEGIRRGDEDGQGAAVDPAAPQEPDGDAGYVAPPSPSPGGEFLLGQDMMVSRRSTDLHRKQSEATPQTPDTPLEDGDSMEYIDGDEDKSQP